MNNFRITFFGIFFTLLTAVSYGQQSFFTHLVQSGVEEVTISTDLTNLLVANAASVEYQPAAFSYELPSGEFVSWDIKVRPRGKYRLRTCDFPPLKLNFGKSDLREYGLADFDKYKLVTHCDEVRTMAHETLLRELVVYKMYEVVTPASYRTHSLRIKYVDSEGRVSGVRRLAFVIESTDELAHRLQAEECEDCLGAAPAQVDKIAEHQQALFQFMIGNTDFSVEMHRNLKLLRGVDGRLTPVPYDFDFAAMVDSPRARPNSHFGQTDIRERIFLGFEVDDALAQRSLEYYQSLRPAFEQLIRAEKGLSVAARVEMRNYLDSFYAELAAMGERPSYVQLRSNAPQAVPAGASPENYGVRK